MAWRARGKGISSCCSNCSRCSSSNHSKQIPKRRGKRGSGGKRWPDGQQLCCWSATKTQSAKQPVDRQLRQLHAQPARSSQSTPPPTWRARRRNRMRARVRRRPPEGRKLPSSAGLAGRPGPSMAWRAGGRSCPAAAERSTQSAQRRGASVA
jgi:hypothetical protein